MSIDPELRFIIFVAVFVDIELPPVNPPFVLPRVRFLEVSLMMTGFSIYSPMQP
jgi:hypothetical protein